MVHHAKQDLYIASTGLSLSLFKKFAELADQCDVIHYHFPWPMMDLAHFVVRSPRPSVVTYHSDVVKQARLLRLYKPLMYKFLSSVDRIVATSPDYLSTSLVLQQFRDKTSVIPIGIASHRPLVREETRTMWQQRLGKDFFLFVGAGRYYKGLDFLLLAARQTGLPVVIAGAELREIPAAQGIPNVSVVGRVDDEAKEALLDLSAALILPSHQRSEAFGVVLAEAARAGRPMITCDIGTGTSYVNLNGLTGIVARPADPRALAEAMLKLAAQAPLRLQMGKSALARFEDLFTAKAMGAAYARLYQEVALSER